MTTGEQAFASFLQTVTDALDRPDVPATEVAARAHLSRYHFDRLIAATAGETPAAFRRRILLERAAYRLVSSGVPILDLALEAGYASHEAFTRAFTRAYSVPPAQWRSRPGRTHRLDSPSGVHFHPPGSLRLPPAQRSTGMDLLNRMVEHHVWLIGELTAAAQGLALADLDRPIETSVDDVDDHPTIRHCLSRLVGQLEMWVASVEGREQGAEDESSIAVIRARWSVVGPQFVGLTKALAEEGRLDETFIDAKREPAAVRTYGGMIAHVVAFGAYRRTLTVCAMRQAGVLSLGWGDPMDWVATGA